MAVNPTDTLNALNAFNRAAKLGGEGLEARDGKPTGSFVELVKEVAGQSIEAGRESEKVTAQAVAGNADLTDVVTAVSNAEATLQTVVAVRDRILSAYQEILRMPI